VRSEREDSAGASRFVPETGELGELSRAVQSCRDCDLYREATQAVFGSGPARSGLVLLGEQPGDGENRRGKPLVGPAGGPLHRALRDAGVDETDTHLTNTVKHFRWHADLRRAADLLARRGAPARRRGGV
jgi:uracil-DNA glycosylase